jgi:hypothetical protein
VSAYYIDEAVLELPEGPTYVDRSVNVIEVPGPDGTELGLIIERTPIPPGKSLWDMAMARSGDDQRKLRSYTLIEERDVEIGGAPSSLLRVRWRHTKGLVYNVQVFIDVGAVCLSLTASCRWENAAECDAWMAALLASMQFRAR